ncbi:GGDEF domain-containing protein [Marinobacterium jannaschii]|uniref:GGDEF domain-containing protein n=1 Tax=Marinobacterium jannaschii TaxID=64970 RepID=UPI000686F8F4|nr:GGDEF domain-containing protein [Marinobacterium jannaschii]
MISFNFFALFRIAGNIASGLSRLVLSLTLLSGSPAVLAEHNIVALLSYDPTLDWSQEFTQALISDAARHPDKVKLYIEYMDSQRLPEPMWHSRQAEYLRHKYASLQVDAVIAESNHAARLLSLHGISIFGQVPQVSVSENRFVHSSARQVHHIPLLPDFAQSLNFAARLRPAPELIAITGDRSPEALALSNGLQQAAAERLPDAAVDVLRTDDLTELVRYVSTLPESTLLFHTLYYQQNGPQPAESAAILASAASVPMLVSYETFLSAGAAGGVLLTAEQAASSALRSALAYIEPPYFPGSYPVKGESWINYPQLQRFSIPARQIPTGSRMLNPPSDSQGPDHYQFAGTVIFILLQLALLVGLSILLRQRNRLTQSLMEINGQLEDKVAERTRELKILASTDSLTGLYNRAEFTTRAKAAMNQAKRQSGSLCLAIIDLDHFKRINDRYGHTSGDQVLKEVARCLQSHFRSYDIVGRYGGEEFSVILPDTSLEQAVAAVDKVRLVVAKRQLEIDSGQQLNISMSAGIAALEYQDDLVTLIKKADHHLYQAKANGRNQVCSATTQAA